jgi:carnitine 3-dehydrogenase
MIAPEEVREVAVVGAGTIGASWVALFLARGLRVTVSSPNPEAEARVRRVVADSWESLQGLSLSPGASPDAWRFEPDVAVAVRAAPFVQESAPESETVKRALYATLEEAMPTDAILASSSSGLLMTDLQRGLARPGRFVIGHPFNPPHLIPLVEVVGGEQTDPAVIAWCVDFYRAIGKQPIHLRREAPGHLANRLQAALLREAVHAVASGLATVADVDAAVTYGPGLRWAIMGPAMTLHLGGGEGGMTRALAQYRQVLEGWWTELGSPTLTPDVCQALVKGV